MQEDLTLAASQMPEAGAADAAAFDKILVKLEVALSKVESLQSLIVFNMNRI